LAGFRGARHGVSVCHVTLALIGRLGPRRALGWRAEMAPSP
jgi:hypothetical protein